MTATTATTLSPNTVSDRPASPTRRRRHPRDSIAMTFRKDNTYEDPTLSLTDNVPEIENTHDDDNDLLTMLRDVAQWDAEQEEVSPREMDMEKTAGNTNSQSTATAETTTTETTPPEETTTIPELGHKKMVRFDKALFHHHPQILGDNPACHEGVPLSIDWKAVETTTRDLSATDNETNNPRSLTELYLTPHQRMHLSRHLLGYSLREIHQACKPVNIARKQRRRTLELLRFHKLHEFVEHLQRTLICQTQPMMMGGSGHYTTVTGSSVQRNSKKTTAVPEDSLRRPRQKNKEALLLDNTQSTHASSTMDDSPTTALSIHQAANRRFSRPTVEEAEA